MPHATAPASAFSSDQLVGGKVVPSKFSVTGRLIAGIGVMYAVCVLEVAVDTQLALEVIVQVTTSPFTRVVDVNVAPVCPDTAVPFTNHW